MNEASPQKWSEQKRQTVAEPTDCSGTYKQPSFRQEDGALTNNGGNKSIIRISTDNPRPNNTMELPKA